MTGIIFLTVGAAIAGYWLGINTKEKNGNIR